MQIKKLCFLIILLIEVIAIGLLIFDVFSLNVIFYIYKSYAYFLSK